MSGSQHIDDDSDEDEYLLRVVYDRSEGSVMILEDDAGMITELILSIEDALALAAAINSLKPGARHAGNN